MRKFIAIKNMNINNNEIEKGQIFTETELFGNEIVDSETGDNHGVINFKMSPITFLKRFREISPFEEMLKQLLKDEVVELYSDYNERSETMYYGLINGDTDTCIDLTKEQFELLGGVETWR